MAGQLDLFKRTPASADLYGGSPPHVRTSDTSAAAAASIRPEVDGLRLRVLETIAAAGSRGMTSDEVEAALALRHQTCSARIRELVLLLRVRDSGARRATSSGRKAAVWVTR